MGLVVLLGFSSFSRASIPSKSGELISCKLTKRFSYEELTTFFKLHKIPKVVLPVRKALNIYEVIYTTIYADSSIVQASGLLYVPVDSGKELPLMIYNHGTEMCRERSCDFTGEQSICLAFATDDYIVLTPDYVGLGSSDSVQLYLNAWSEARTSVDMLLAVKKALPQIGVPTNSQLFLTGYSQGGHASMATARLLQQDYSKQFPVTAAAPMSGPYDVELTVYGGRNKKFGYPAFFLLLLQSYYESIHNYNGFAAVFAHPYDKLFPVVLDGDIEISDANKLLPDTVYEVFTQQFLKDFEDSSSGFRKFLRTNNVYDWKPQMPMQLCYCNGDEEVNYKNSIETYETMKRNGSTTVELWRAGKKFGHVNCALFAVVYTKMFFDGFRNGHPGSHGPGGKRALLNIGKIAVKAY